MSQAELRFGNYRVIELLGQGGMGNAYLAQQEGSGLDRLAVVKSVRASMLAEPEIVERFVHEARVNARMSHPNIVQIYELGDVDGVPYVVMEHVHGRSFDRVIAKAKNRGERLPLEITLRVCSDVLRALSFAHEYVDEVGVAHNIIHRDVKPGNVLVGFDGRVKLIDFGLAKTSTSTLKTSTGVIRGTLAYMAPEQALGQKVDARCDLFAVGAMLFELIEGRVPFDRGEPLPTLRAIVDDPTPPITAEVPESLRAVIEHLLAKNRDVRFGSAAAALQALSSCGQAADDATLRTYMRGLFDRKALRQLPTAEIERRSSQSQRTLPPESGGAVTLPPDSAAPPSHRSQPIRPVGTGVDPSGHTMAAYDSSPSSVATSDTLGVALATADTMAPSEPGPSAASAETAAASPAPAATTAAQAHAAPPSELEIASPRSRGRLVVVVALLVLLLGGGAFGGWWVFGRKRGSTVKKDLVAAGSALAGAGRTLAGAGSAIASFGGKAFRAGQQAARAVGSAATSAAVKTSAAAKSAAKKAGLRVPGGAGAGSGSAAAGGTGNSATATATSKRTTKRRRVGKRSRRRRKTTRRAAAATAKKNAAAGSGSSAAAPNVAAVGKLTVVTTPAAAIAGGGRGRATLSLARERGTVRVRGVFNVALVYSLSGARLVVSLQSTPWAIAYPSVGTPKRTPLHGLGVDSGWLRVELKHPAKGAMTLRLRFQKL